MEHEPANTHAAAAVADPAGDGTTLTARGEKSFEADVRQVAAGLQRALAKAIGELPGRTRRAADLRRALSLDTRLSTQLFKFAFAAEPASLIAHMPGEPSMRRFIDALRASPIGTGPIDRLESEYARFGRLVIEHAGDRITFDSMAAGLNTAVGTLDATDNGEVTHRRAVFRGMSHVLGVQAQTQFHVSVVRPCAGADRIDLVSIRGFGDLRRLRREANLPLACIAEMQSDGEQLPGGFVRELLPGSERLANGIGLVREFSTMRGDVLRFDKLPGGFDLITLAGETVGSDSSVDACFGSVLRRLASPDARVPGSKLALISDVFVPIKRLVREIVVPDGYLRDSPPAAEVYLNQMGLSYGRDNLAQGRLPVHVDVKFVVSRPLRKLAGHSAYAKLIAHAAQGLEWDFDCDLYRMEMSYPILQSLVTTSVVRSAAPTADETV